MAKKKTRKKAKKKTARRKAKRRKRVTRTRRSPEEKRAILEQYDAAERGEGKAAVLAKYSVYQSQMSTWRKSLGAPPRRSGKKKTRKKTARRNRAGRRESDRELQAENERLRAILAHLLEEGKVKVDDIL